MSTPGNEPNVLNLIILGTGQRYKWVKTILTELADQVEISATQSMHLIDGVNSKAKKMGVDLMVGTYDFSCEYDPNSGVIYSHKKPRLMIRSATSSFPQIRGDGYRDTIAEALAVIKAMHEAGKTPLILNIYAFSHAADIAIRLANILNNLYSREMVQINIFAIDPILSASRQSIMKARFVSANIKNYVSILMKDEYRPNYEAQDQAQLIVQDTKTTNVTFHLYHGKHASAQIFRENRSNFAAQLTYDDIQLHAKQVGTRLKQRLRGILKQKHNNNIVYSYQTAEPALTDEARLKLHTEMKYEAMARKKTPKPPDKKRKFIGHLSDYFFHGIHFFNDKQHMLLFQKMYPNFFDYFFQMNKAESKPNQVLADLTKLNRDQKLVKLINQLVLVGKEKIADMLNTQTLPKPAGIPVTVTALDTNPELMNIWKSIQNACNVVTSGYDISIKRKTVLHFKKYALSILLSGASVKTKIAQLNDATLQLLTLCKYQDLFALSLMQINPSAPQNIIVNNVIKSLEQINKQDFTLFNTNQSAQSRMVLARIIALLSELQNINNIDVTVVHEALANSLSAYNNHLSKDTHHSLIKNPVEAILQQAMLDISYLNNTGTVKIEEELHQKIKSLTDSLQSEQSANPSERPQL